MFNQNLIFAVVLSLVILFAVNVFADTDITYGIISQNTTWSLANSPYLVHCNILVQQDATLTIEPGVVIKFDVQCAMQIDGKLVAIGTETDRITFTSNLPNPQPGDWGRIFFSDPAQDAILDTNAVYSDGCVLQYCTLTYGGGDSEYGTSLATIQSSYSSMPYVDNCIIQYSQSGGIYCNYNGDSLNIFKLAMAHN